ncbi:MAG: DotI/IcmL family type IV secretion protein [Alphaproteobacteria bacterium]
MKKLLCAAVLCAALGFGFQALAQEEAAQPLTPAAPIPQRVAPPSSTPAAPAAPGAIDWLKYKDPYVGEQNDIKNSNRTLDEITVWAQSRATELMSFTPEDFSKKLSDIKKTFVPAGWNEYATYLQTSKMVEMVRDRQYTVTTIVNGDSLILDSRSVAGAFHWIVQMPLMVTFLHPDSNNEMAAVAGGEFRLTMSIGRVQAGGIEGMAVESWKIETMLPKEPPPVAPMPDAYVPPPEQ